MADIVSAVNLMRPVNALGVLQGGEQLRALRNRNQLAPLERQLLEQRTQSNENALGLEEDRINALQAGDLNALAQVDPVMARQQQLFAQEQLRQASTVLRPFASRVAASENPKALARILMDSPELDQLPETLVSQLRATDLDAMTDDEVRAEAKGLVDSLNSLSGNRFGVLGNTDIPSDVRTAIWFEGLTPEQQKNFLTVKRSRQVEQIGGVPTDITGGGMEPLTTLQDEAQAAQTLAQARAEGQAEVVTAKTRQDLRAKYPRLRAADRRLDRVKEASDALSDNRFLRGGPGQQFVAMMTEEGQEITQANRQLLAELTALTRVPGIGAQSDFEQRLQEMVLPNAGMFKSVRDNAIKELELFMQDLEGAFNVLGEAEEETIDSETQNRVEALRREVQQLREQTQ